MNFDARSAAEKGLGERFDAAPTAADFLAVWLSAPMLSAPNQTLLDAYYRNFRGMRSPRIRHWYNQQLAEADNLLRASPGLRVLEIGVGTGTEFLWWAQRGADITGIDVFPHCVAATAERLEILENATGRKTNSQLKVVSVLDFDDDAGFDLIWMEQVFHHLEPRAEIVPRIAKLLRPGGHVVLSEANALNPLLQLQLFRSRGFKMVLDVPSEHGTVMYGNERVLSRRRLARWFQKVGIKEESARYYRVFPAHPLFEPLFGLEKQVTSPWLAPLYTHYNFVGRKVS